jgi:hypothetical protein
LSGAPPDLPVELAYARIALSGYAPSSVPQAALPIRDLPEKVRREHPERERLDVQVVGTPQPSVRNEKGRGTERVTGAPAKPLSVGPVDLFECPGGLRSDSC